MNTQQRFALHVTKWSNCQRCFLKDSRTNVVLGRGDIPADIVFVGEAPGGSEDLDYSGQAFVGPAGNLLDTIIAQSLPPGWTFCITNLVGCIPLGDDGNKVAKPDYECIMACKSRVEELIDICNPKLVIGVGALARDWLSRGLRDSVKYKQKIAMIDIVHPAAILRMNTAIQGLTVQKCVIAISTAVDEIVNPTSDLRR